MILATDNEYPKATNGTVIAAILSFIAGLCLLMSFASPYWIESYPEMFSSFKHMGMWEYCFENFRYPYYQFPKLFTGCHYIFSMEYYVIREWLLPGWLMMVQALVTLALIGSITAQVVLAMVCIRWPLRSILRYEWAWISLSFVCTAGASAFMFLAVVIFGSNCYRRDWLMYPSFNVLSWSYALAVVSFMIFGVAALLLYRESMMLYESRREAKNLVMQMHESQPATPSEHYPHHRSGYI